VCEASSNVLMYLSPVVPPLPSKALIFVFEPVRQVRVLHTCPSSLLVHPPLLDRGRGSDSLSFDQGLRSSTCALPDSERLASLFLAQMYFFLFFPFFFRGGFFCFPSWFLFFAFFFFLLGGSFFFFWLCVFLGGLFYFLVFFFCFLLVVCLLTFLWPPSFKSHSGPLLDSSSFEKTFFVRRG